MTSQVISMSRVCRRLARGESIRRISADPKLPNSETIYQWLQDDPVFRARYAIAAAYRSDRLAEEVLELADALPQGAAETETRRQRLRIEARRWAAARLDAQFRALNGSQVAQAEAGPSVQVEVVFVEEAVPVPALPPAVDHGA